MVGLILAAFSVLLVFGSGLLAQCLGLPQQYLLITFLVLLGLATLIFIGVQIVEAITGMSQHLGQEIQQAGEENTREIDRAAEMISERIDGLADTTESQHVLVLEPRKPGSSFVGPSGQGDDRPPFQNKGQKRKRNR